MLHTPVYDVPTRAFCGPTAISAVTGAPISQIRELVRALRPARKSYTDRNGSVIKAKLPIMGMSNRELIDTMKALGWWAGQSWKSKDQPFALMRTPMRLGELIDAFDRIGSGPYIINVTGHYYAYSHGEICDTATQIPMEVKRWKRGRQRHVVAWWKFEQA